jgi:hypothetical protein
MRLSAVKLSVIMLSVMRLSAVKLSVIMLSVIMVRIIMLMTQHRRQRKKSFITLTTGGGFEGRRDGQRRVRVRRRRDGQADEHQSKKNAGANLPVTFSNSEMNLPVTFSK